MSNGKEIRAVVSDEAYRVFVDLINRTSMSAQQTQFFAGELLSDAIADKMEVLVRGGAGATDPLQQINYLAFTAARRQNSQEMFNFAAAAAQTEEEAEHILRLGDEANLDVEQADAFVKKTRNNSLFVSVVADGYSPATKLGRCMIWLSVQFSNNVRIPKTLINKQAMDEDWSAQTLQRAKAKMEIGHEKEGNVWYWLAPSVNISQVQHQHATTP